MPKVGRRLAKLDSALSSGGGSSATPAAGAAALPTTGSRLPRASIDNGRLAGRSGRPLPRDGPTASGDPDGFRAFFQAHGYAVCRNVLSAADLAPAREAIDAVVGEQAAAWLAEGLLSSVHGHEPFERRLAAIAEELPDRIFGDRASPVAS